MRCCGRPPPNLPQTCCVVKIHQKSPRARIIMDIPCAVQVIMETRNIHYYSRARWNFRTQGCNNVCTSGNECFINCPECCLYGKRPTRPTIIMHLSCAMQDLLHTGNIHYYSRARCSFVTSIVYLFVILRIHYTRHWHQYLIKDQRARE